MAAMLSAKARICGARGRGARTDRRLTLGLCATDGTAQPMGRRERPFVLFGEGGKPEVLYTAVCATAPFGDCFAIANPLSPHGFLPNSTQI
eukprot:SAG31_NODE_1375_length_8594_cov_2.810477_2_plen_91_part_00